MDIIDIGYSLLLIGIAAAVMAGGAWLDHRSRSKRRADWSSESNGRAQR